MTEAETIELVPIVSYVDYERFDYLKGMYDRRTCKLVDRATRRGKYVERAMEDGLSERQALADYAGLERMVTWDFLKSNKLNGVITLFDFFLFEHLHADKFAKNFLKELFVKFSMERGGKTEKQSLINYAALEAASKKNFCYLSAGPIHRDRYLEWRPFKGTVLSLDVLQYFGFISECEVDEVLKTDFRDHQPRTIPEVVKVVKERRGENFNLPELTKLGEDYDRIQKTLPTREELATLSLSTDMKAAADELLSRTLGFSEKQIIAYRNANENISPPDVRSEKAPPKTRKVARNDQI